MVTQSFAFREPVSELGQTGVFTVPNMNMPWKQGAFVLQSDGRLMGPGTPEKPQIKRRRNSPVSMQQDGRELRGTYNSTSQLTPGRLANGSLQSTLEPQDLSADNNINFGDFDPQSLELENGGLHSTVTPPIDFSTVAGDFNGSAMADSFNYPSNSTGNMNLPTTPHPGGAASAGPFEAAEAMTARALTNLEALLAPAGAAGSHHHAYSGPEGHQHHHHNININIQASSSPNVNMPASYMLGDANSFSPSLFTGPNFGSAAPNHHHHHHNNNNNNNNHHHSYLDPPKFPNGPFLTPNSIENSQISSMLRPSSVSCNMSSWGHHLNSQASSVEQQQGDHHHHHHNARSHALNHSSAQPVVPRIGGDSLIMQQTHAYNTHVNAVAATPEKNRDGRRLSYVAAAAAAPEQESPSSQVAAFHAFEATTPPPRAPNSVIQTEGLGTLHAHVYNMSGMLTHQQVEAATITTTQMPAAILDSVVDSTVQEDPSLQEMFTQTYDPPMMTTAEMDSAQKEGYQFDLNEVPVGATESTPNKRKKYHPRVAKDKRTYKPRKKLDNAAAAPVTPHGISAAGVGGHTLGSNASTPAGSKRNHTTFMTNMTNVESFKDGMYSDVDVDMEPGAGQHHLGTENFIPATPVSPDGTPSAGYNNNNNNNIAENTPKSNHLNTASLNTPFNHTAPHDTAICDCEACIRIRLEKTGSVRRISGKGSRTRQYIDPTNAPQSPYEEQSFSSPSHVQAWSENTGLNMFMSGLHHHQQGPTSAALNNNVTEIGNTELSFMGTPNSRSRRRNLFNQTIFTTQAPEEHATAQNYTPAAAAGDSPAQNAVNFLQPNHVQQELQQPIGGHPHHSYPRPVRRSLMGQFTLPPAPPPPQATPEESRSLSSNFGGNSSFESEEATTQSTRSRLENYSNSHSQAMVPHQQQQQQQQDPYTVVRSYFDQAHQDTTQGSSCLQQFNQAATERGFIRRVDSYNDETAELMRMGDMVARRREPPSLHQHMKSTMFHQAHQNLSSTTTALSALSYHHHHHGEQFQGALVPASGRLNWNPDLIPYTLHPRRMASSSSSFMSRLCPRGILSPQRTPFRMMTKIQRIVYLKTILMSHHLDTSPTLLLHHVQEHLPSHEKDAFELLWPLILEPVSKEELQRLVEIAEADTTTNITTNISSSSGLELTEYVSPVDKRKQRGRKPGTKNKGQQQNNNMGKAMTLWPDLIEQGHHPKPGKQKGDKGGDRQERQNSNGRDTQGLELVPYEGKAVVPYDGPFLPLRKRKPRPKVVLDTETVRVWKLLMGKPGPMDSSTEADANKLKWEEERRLMKTQADIFIKRMHLVQGDRSFSRWKGSVVDSVVGAFLTQNVNDVLSSSAFMCMRSRFPGRGFKGPLQSKAPEEALGQPLETEAGNSSPAPLAERMGEPQSSSGHQEESSSGGATSHIVSVESRPPSLESEESHNEERLYPAHLGVRHEETMSWPDQEGEQQRQLGTLELQQQLLQQQMSIPTELSQTAENTNSLNASDSNSAGTFPVTNSTEQTTAEESTGANIIDTQLDLLSLAQQGTNEVRDLAMENDVGSELVTSNMNNNINPQLQQQQQQTPKGPKVFNSKSGLTGPERARQEEKQVTARKTFDWEHRREEFKPRGPGEEPNAAPPRTELTEDGVDWEAVRHANVEEVASVIKERGLNWILAGRIKAFLERLQVEHGALDLEWLRSIPTDDTKEYLLSIRGLGLKSVECIRLLTLHHLAFPVDTNVGRICVRLGWVPLEPLPEELQLHLLELYPVQATIQKYLWPRLCTLDQQTLYELHYQMITFGKVFCTKSKPNCNACPMKADCKHFASALSSAKLALPASERPNNGPTLALPPGTASSNGDAGESQAQGLPQMVEEDRPRSMPVSQYCQPIVEEPMTPESSEADAEDCDIEDYPFSVEEVEDDSNMNLYIEEKSTGQIEQQVEIPNCCSTSDLSVTISESEPVQEMIMEDWGGLAMPSQTSHSQLNSEQDSSPNTAIKIVESEVDPESPSVTQSTAVLIPDAPSQELVLVNPENAHIPVPKLKNIGRLRTVHYVYELPDNHPLVEGMDVREADDPCTYLLAIWSPGEVPESIPNINDRDNSDENPYASSSFEGEAESIKATLLVPCRTAMQGSFPLNGTYFQVNEVFADHASSLQPILVPRTLLWNLRRRFVFFGTSVTSIFRGMTVEEIQACFWRGYVCVRGFDRTTRAPKPLVGRLHLQASKTSGKGAPMEN